MREINIGAQGFDKLRENGNFYIDKTSFIREWWESEDDVTLITRPRRFGKTLNLRMLECFFSNRYAGRGDLFEGLEIWKDEKFRKLQGTFPVILLSFASIKSTDYAKAAGMIKIAIWRMFQDFSFLVDSGRLSPGDRQFYLSVKPDMSDDIAAASIGTLCDFLYRYYGKRVIVLLDEYDTPMQEAFVGGYWDEMSGFIRSLFNSTFKTNPSMERAVMTGITRISKESIFSDLNNPNVVTTTSGQYETAFGFTEEEVRAALAEYGLGERFPEVKNWYDGFTFGDVTDIYNPWSILNYLKKKRLAPYWANTSSNSLISYELRVSDNSIKQQMEELLKGGTIQTELDEQIVFSQLDSKANAMWSLFLAGGYLKICGREFDGDVDHYTLALTNHEVEVMFRSLIREWFDPAADSYTKFTQALVEGNTEWLNYYLNDLLLNVAGSFDTRKKVLPGHEPESFYHGLVLGLIATEQNYKVSSNRESGLGRYDIMMRPAGKAGRKGAAVQKEITGAEKRETSGTEKRSAMGSSPSAAPALIIEFKVFDPKKEKNLSETADRALAQIEERRYDTELLREGFSREDILHYGMAFRGKEAVVKAG